MRTLLLALLLAVSASAAGCAASVSRVGYPAGSPPAATAMASGESCPVLITTDSAAVAQAQARPLGEIRYGDTGFSTQCDETRAFRLFEREACAVGANVVLIAAERGPDHRSTCYRATARLYSVGDTLALAHVSDRRAPDLFAVSREAGGGPQLLSVVGYAVGFAAGYLLVSLLMGGE